MSALLRAVQADITKLQLDAIVNAATRSCRAAAVCMAPSIVRQALNCCVLDDAAAWPARLLSK